MRERETKRRGLETDESEKERGRERWGCKGERHTERKRERESCTFIMTVADLRL